MNPVVPWQADTYAALRITASLADDWLQPRRCRRRCRPQTASERVPVHVKVDTGLGRFGSPEEVVPFVQQLHDCPGWKCKEFLPTWPAPMMTIKRSPG